LIIIKLFVPVTAEISKQLNDCHGKIIVTLPDFVPKINAIEEECTSLKYSVVIGDSADVGWLDFSSMLESDPASALILKGTEIDTDNFVAIIPYSSGTTVIHTKYSKEFTSYVGSYAK